MSKEVGEEEQLTSYQVSQLAASARSLVEDILSLEEPWRCRFVELMVDRRRATTDGSVNPTRAQMIAWLCDDELYQEIRTLYRL
ncbi:MAG: hypothetical protein ACP5JG_01540, partial [Anaerolineae bacterium]